MCIGIYFVDKEIVQHWKVSVKCGKWLGLRQLEQIVETWLQTLIKATEGWPAVKVQCRNVIDLPTFFPSGDKITFNYIKIHINRDCSSSKLPDSSSTDKIGTEQSNMSQDCKWYFLAYQRHGGILVCGITGTVSKPKIPIFPFTLCPRHDT